MRAFSFQFYKVLIACDDIRDSPWFAEGPEDMKDLLVAMAMAGFDVMWCHGYAHT